MLLSITILSYKSPPILRLCLKSLYESLSSDPDLDYEIIVIDNASSYATQSVVNDEFKNKFKNIKIIALKENCGYTKGVNEGLKASKGDYILYTNHDVVFQSGAIEKLIDFMKNNPNVGLVGPELKNFNNSHQNSYFRFYSPFTILYRRIPHLPGTKKALNEFLMKDSDHNNIIEPDWISGAIFMTSKKAVQRVGFMDENLFHYFSDVDWAKRFWENGYKVVYFPESKVFHYHGRASKGKLGAFDFIYKREARWHILDGLKFFNKYGFRKIQRN